MLVPVFLEFNCLCFGRRLTHAVWCGVHTGYYGARFCNLCGAQFVWCTSGCYEGLWLCSQVIAARQWRHQTQTTLAAIACGARSAGGIEDMVAFIVMASLGQFMLCRLSHDILCQISAFIFDVNIHHNLARLRRCCSWR